MSKFKVGDVVRLNSGGPFMTVTYIDEEDGKVYVEWFGSDTERPLSANFPSAALQAQK